MVSVFADIVKDFPKMRNLPKIFLNVCPDYRKTVFMMQFICDYPIR